MTPCEGCSSTRILVSLTHYTFLKKGDGGWGEARGVSPQYPLKKRGGGGAPWPPRKVVGASPRTLPLRSTRPRGPCPLRHRNLHARRCSPPHHGLNRPRSRAPPPAQCSPQKHSGLSASSELHEVALCPPRTGPVQLHESTQPSPCACAPPRPSSGDCQGRRNTKDALIPPEAGPDGRTAAERRLRA